MTKPALAHIALFISTVVFGANYYISKDLLSNNINPEQLLFIRTIGAGIIFWLVGLFIKTELPDKKTLLVLIPAALFGVVLNQLFFFKGLQHTTAVNASIIHVCNPIVVMVLSMIFLKFPITPKKAIGVFLGAIGASILILLDKSLTFAMDSMKGNLLIVSGTIAYGAYLILTKPLLQKYSPIVIVKWIYLYSSIMILPFCLPQMTHFEYAQITSNQWISLVFVIVSVTFLAYLLTMFALKHLMPTLVSYYIYLQPIIASIIAYSLGGEKLGIAQLIAAVLIVSGVVLVNRSGMKKQLKET